MALGCFRGLEVVLAFAPGPRLQHPLSQPPGRGLGGPVYAGVGASHPNGAELAITPVPPN